jgi:hypothetical protein
MIVEIDTKVKFVLPKAKPLEMVIFIAIIGPCG